METFPNNNNENNKQPSPIEVIKKKIAEIEAKSEIVDLSAIEHSHLNDLKKELEDLEESLKHHEKFNDLLDGLGIDRPEKGDN